ncbi:hypothetical protein LCGC14_2260760 [marine sediment metagenome]|uniref:Uncharacterized protein n=1 Tax=marine sediment metagenome TaxID=412755 RepID=A0A0F9CZS5_9ZZZZ
MSRLPDTENLMVLPRADDEPTPTPPEDDGEEQRQREIDEIRRTIKRFGYLSLAVRQAD